MAESVWRSNYVAGSKLLDAEKPAEKPAEAEAEKPAEAATPPTEKRKDGGAEPDAKRLKPTPPDPAVVRKQVEYYLSDENLKYDKFFHDKISANAEGWLDMSFILSCNKMKAMRAGKDDVVAALKESKIELNEGSAAVRRPGNAPLPKLESRPSHPAKKNSIHAHDGGVVAIFRNIPEEQQWTHVKAVVQEKLPAKVNLWHVSHVSDKNECSLACAPFDGDVAFFEGLTIELGGATLKCEVCFADVLQKVLKEMPKHIRDKRERESRKRQKERNRPIKLGTCHFNNVTMLRGRVKEILNSRSDNEQLKPDGSDFKLIKSLLDYHPSGPGKSAGLVGIKVGKSQQGDSRCFYMIKEGGKEEDFSAKKCLDAVEQKPPYVQPEEKPAGDKRGQAAKAAPKGAAAKPEETKPDKKEEEKPAEPAEKAKETTEEAEGKKEEDKAEKVEEKKSD
ncbi:La [Symbiodinium pilosum]|uniref:La protein n=1 Tax=Symbiodinium pilosum TaxID=2952 RepID=A0A812Q0D5_SYMPI|nr:La [Symbiodinium pilosum]